MRRALGSIRRILAPVRPLLASVRRTLAPVRLLLGPVGLVLGPGRLLLGPGRLLLACRPLTGVDARPLRFNGRALKPTSPTAIPEWLGKDGARRTTHALASSRSSVAASCWKVSAT